MGLSAPVLPDGAVFQAAPVRRWAVLCGTAEAVGMTAAATAARVAAATVGDASRAREVALGVGIVVAGGLVEGTALGVAQAAGLRAWRPRIRVAAYVLATVTVAGLGWAAVSTPVALAGSTDTGSAGPAAWLAVAGGGALGAAMGGLLGAAQAATLRRQVPHPWRWVGANALAWVPAMAVIFVGAGLPGTDWPTGAVVASGTVTGAVAGALLGALLGWSLPSLHGAALHNRIVVALLGGSPGTPGTAGRARRGAGRLLAGAVIGLRVRGVVSGRWMELPVMYAADAAGLVVVPGHWERKRWWRNLRHPAAVVVLHEGRWQPAEAVVLSSGDPGYAEAVATYQHRWRRVTVPAGCPIVRVRT